MTGSNKTRSPATPSRSLGDCVADVAKLYKEFTHSNFARSEIGSKLGISSTSGPFNSRLFTLKEYGLLDQNGSEFSVSSSFLTLHTTEPTQGKFKKTALEAINKSDTFRELLSEFKTKLPSQETVATRLETQKKFNNAKAKEAARVLETSLRYAGVLDGNNNILPVRDTASTNGNGGGGQEEPEDPDVNGDVDAKTPGLLNLEIPVGERKVIVRYPHDLTGDEAIKIGKVLAAVVG